MNSHFNTDNDGRIRELEAELEKKNSEVEAYRSTIELFTTALKKTSEAFEALDQQFKLLQSQLEHAGTYADKLIEQLRHDNKNLRSSNNIWLKRAIKLELDLVSARKHSSVVESELVSAKTRIQRLEDDLNRDVCNLTCPKKSDNSTDNHE